MCIGQVFKTFSLYRLSSQAHEESKGLREKLNTLSEDYKQLKEKLGVSVREKQATEKKLSVMHNKLTSALQELNEERQLGKALRYNQQQWQNKTNKLEEKYNDLKANSEKEVTELREELKDVMFHLEAHQMFENHEEKDSIAGGTITVVDNAQNTQNKRRTRNRKRH